MRPFDSDTLTQPEKITNETKTQSLSLYVYLIQAVLSDYLTTYTDKYMHVLYTICQITQSI